MLHPVTIPPAFLLWIIPIIVVDLILRGMALWRSAQRRQLWWFVALLIVNSSGILPIIYLLVYGGKVQTPRAKR